MNCPICSNSNHKKSYQLYDDRYGYSGIFNLYICDDCKHGMLDLNLTDDEITDLYTKYYPRSSCDLENRPLKKEDPSKYQEWQKGKYANAYKWVPKNVRILDIGCGYGEAMGYHIARGCEAFGVEADSNVLKAKEKYNYNIHIGAFNKNIYETNYFDYVTMDQVIEHLQDPVSQIKDIYGILKPGGILIISTPNSNSLTAKLLREKWLHWHVPYHVHFFSKHSISLLAEKTGFKLIKCKTITEYSWLRMQLIHLFNYPSAGERSLYWSDSLIKNKSFKPRSLSTKLIDKLTGYNIIHIFNKLFDLLGVGDNYLIVLMKN